MELEQQEQEQLELPGIVDAAAEADALKEEARAKKAALRKAGTIKLQGKEYLQVAHRVLVFRTDFPDASIRTGYEQVGDHFVATCQIVNKNNVLAVAHKQVNFNSTKKGPAKDCPFEMAETGAVGRALGLCGYGTLHGDLDLDPKEEIADAPQAKARVW